MKRACEEGEQPPHMDNIRREITLGREEEEEHTN